MADIDPSVAEQALKSARPETDKESSVAGQGSVEVFSLSQGHGDVVAQKGFVLTQRILVLVAICVVLFSVFDTYSNQPDRMSASVQQPFDSISARVSPETMPLSRTVDLFVTRRIFGPPPVEEVVEVEAVVPVRGWRAELRDHWSLMGTSEVVGATDDLILEAIVQDGRAQRLQFLRAGEKVRVVEHEVEITRVDQDRVEFRHGDEVFVLD